MSEAEAGARGAADIAPGDIEKKSFEMISLELERLAAGPIAPENAAVVKRAIHASADFDYAESLYFSEGAVSKGIDALRRGCLVVTDTNMALAGINKAALERLSCSAACFIADEDVREAAQRGATSRAAAAIDKAASLPGKKIYAIGNAPTALIRLCRLAASGEIEEPELLIAAPVGFVNVLESKEIAMGMNAPKIVARGRKGGSTIAAAIVNALLYSI
jgi:precorrin-8X/cobalt-precorrin-8 methylmutase